MSRTFTLVDSLALNDLQTFLGRTARIEDGSVRLIAGSGVLATYIAVFYPVGLHDEMPTVLALRTFALSGSEAFDVVVPIRSLLDRLAKLKADAVDETLPIEVGVPIEVNTVVWASVSPPKGGWYSLDEIESELLARTAESGIEEIKTALPPGLGEHIVHKARAEVWSRPIPGAEHIPSGAAFAAQTLGFLVGAESIRVFETGPWTRLSMNRGHILVRRKPWTLQASS
ncbi:MAG: hypothetical protein IT191_02655 [Microbacteriaceae bacterium]|nr:hypothetical protein [Microbacteriaceae bacterium]